MALHRTWKSTFSFGYVPTVGVETGSAQGMPQTSDWQHDPSRGIESFGVVSRAKKSAFKAESAKQSAATNADDDDDDDDDDGPPKETQATRIQIKTVVRTLHHDGTENEVFMFPYPPIVFSTMIFFLLLLF